MSKNRSPDKSCKVQLDFIFNSSVCSHQSSENRDFDKMEFELTCRPVSIQLYNKNTDPVSNPDSTPALVRLQGDAVHLGCARVTFPGVTNSDFLQRGTVPVYLVPVGGQDFPGPDLCATLTSLRAPAPFPPLAYFALSF